MIFSKQILHNECRFGPLQAIICSVVRSSQQMRHCSVVGGLENAPLLLTFGVAFNASCVISFGSVGLRAVNACSVADCSKYFVSRDEDCGFWMPSRTDSLLLIESSFRYVVSRVGGIFISFRFAFVVRCHIYRREFEVEDIVMEMIWL